jgi:cytochrome c oxidase cbb3-type subunit I
MESVVRRLGIWGSILLLAIIALALAQDTAFAVHMGLIAVVAALLAVLTMARFDPMARAQSIFRMPPGPSRMMTIRCAGA